MKNQDGKSLIGLIITLVVVLIIGAVIIFALVGENGLFKSKSYEEIWNLNSISENNTNTNDVNKNTK